MRATRFAGVVIALSMTGVGCAQQLSKEEKLRMQMDNAPFIAPMAAEDISDPQTGYTHQTIEITGGNYLYIKAGNSRVEGDSKPKPIEFTKFDLYAENQVALIFNVEDSSLL